VAGEGYYKGNVYIAAQNKECHSDFPIIGPMVSSPPNEGVFSVAEEVEFYVGSTVLYAKSLQASSGNKVAKESSSDITLKAGAAAKDGPEVGLEGKSGVSYTVEKAWKPVDQTLFADAVTTPPNGPFELNKQLPSITFALKTHAQVTADVNQRIVGYASAKTLAAGLWWVGKASGGCGVEKDVDGYSWTIMGEEPHETDMVRNMVSWMKSEGVYLNKDLERVATPEKM